MFPIVVFPLNGKHCIIPIVKAGNKNLDSNYRPISLLYIVSKVLEHIIHSKVATIICDRISTLQLLLIFFKDIYEHYTQTDVIYLDFSKAFDKVPHNELLLKLRHFGITGNLWCWFKSYLNNIFQCVFLNGSYSALRPVLSGVPQGSILGPLLLLVNINNLSMSIHHSKSLSHADNTKCY